MRRTDTIHRTAGASPSDRKASLPQRKNDGSPKCRLTNNRHSRSSTRYRLRSGAERLTISPKKPAKKVCTPSPTASKAI